jgi:hypothetical protein
MECRYPQIAHHHRIGKTADGERRGKFIDDLDQQQRRDHGRHGLCQKANRAKQYGQIDREQYPARRRIRSISGNCPIRFIKETEAHRHQNKNVEAKRGVDQRAHQLPPQIRRRRFSLQHRQCFIDTHDPLAFLAQSADRDFAFFCLALADDQQMRDFCQ